MKYRSDAFVNMYTANISTKHSLYNTMHVDI